MSLSINVGQQVPGLGVTAIKSEIVNSVYQNPVAVTGRPRMLIMGTAEKGSSTRPYYINQSNQSRAKDIFGANGSLREQIFEAMTFQGAGQKENDLLAVRIAARPCFLQHIGGTAGTSTAHTPLTNGLRVECAEGGEEWGTRLGICYAAASTNLVIYDRAASAIVYDNRGDRVFDAGLIYLSGEPVLGSGSDLGTPTAYPQQCVYVPFNSATALDPGIRFYGGESRVVLHMTEDISFQELYLECLRALRRNEGAPVLYYAAPDRAYLNAPFSTSVTTSTRTGTWYPDPGASDDMLGKVYIEMHNGVEHAYWDINNDGVPERWSINDTGNYAATSKGGIVWTATSTYDGFSEPNFGYLFAYQMHLNTVEYYPSQACVPVGPPRPARPLNEWLGTAPVYTTDLNGTETVATNGSGLLGHKYLAGATDYRNAIKGGGMVLTDRAYFDNGEELFDSQGNPIDIGKYIFIWGFQESFAYPPGVIGPGAIGVRRVYPRISPAAYVGWRSTLPIGSAPTNKNYAVGSSRMLDSLSNSQLQALKNAKITTVRSQPGSTPRILDAPTAALKTSPFSRQGIMEVQSFVNESLKILGDRYIGRPLPAEEEAAFQKDLDEAMVSMVKSRILTAGSARLIITPAGRTTGTADVQVVIRVPFELQRINYSISLSV